ncbi:MAG: spermidine synthase [Sphingobium sp.]
MAEASAKSRFAPELVDTGDIPGGGQLQLFRYGEDYSIQYYGDELMGSRDHYSERALATMTCERLGSNDGRILIGGLGMGFTLGAALSAWSKTSDLTVVELVPKVIEWARGPLSHISGRHISDPRVTLHLADVHDTIAAANGRFDAILLDVDNGPDGFIKVENDRLYCAWGLRAAYAALRGGGILAIWSAYPDSAFAPILEAAGFKVEEVRIAAYGNCEEDWHNIWFARKSSDLVDAI